MAQYYAKTKFNMKNKHFFLAAIMAIAVSLIMTACNKNSSSEAPVTAGKQQLSLYLTDGPALFDKVLINIKSVKVLIDTCTNTRHHDNDDWDDHGEHENKKDSCLVWEDLKIKAGIYDILKFRNGADTLLAASSITKGYIRLIKIELGTENSLVKDSVTYPLALPAFAKNYVLLKLKGNEFDEFLPGKSRLWIDFDVNKSIYQGRDNRFYLSPRCHFFTVQSTGSIAGKVLPKEAYSVITVYNSKDTAYALPNRDGYFKLRGLKDGTYSAFFNASNNGYRDTTITKIVVTAPNETSLGTITLRK